MYREKTELPVLVVAILIFLSSLGFLAFAVYYIAFLPVPTPMQSLKTRVLTTFNIEKSSEEEEVSEKEEELKEEEEEDFEDKKYD